MSMNYLHLNLGSDEEKAEITTVGRYDARNSATVKRLSHHSALIRMYMAAS